MYITYDMFSLIQASIVVKDSGTVSTSSSDFAMLQ